MFSFRHFFALIILFQAASVAHSQKNSNFTFTNPIISKGADPWIIQKDGRFYYCYSSDNAIHVRENKHVHEMKDGKIVADWTPPSGQNYSKELWAPELHFIQGNWYIYFAADDGQNEHHRMYVLKSKDSKISSGFEFVGQVKTPDDKWAIDGTVLELNKQLYFIWSGWEGDVNVAQDLYIAKMSSPTEVSSARARISQPDFEWEKRGSGNGLPTINEGPQILRHNGDVFVIYSAAGSWSNFYCLGQLKLTGKDPLQPSSWTKKSNPVFESSGNVFSPGHASFLHIAGKDWIVYHTAVQKDAGWNRHVKMQPFSWNDNEPDFGTPLANGVNVQIKY